jgi:2,3-dihydroxybenzoate decarboxylase
MTEWHASDYYRQSGLQQAMAEEQLGLLTLEGAERILDVGCGDGKITAEIAARVPRGSALGVDPSSSPTEFRDFYLSSRGEHIGHNIVDQLADLDAQRLAYMDAAGIDIQVLSFTSPGPQAFDAAEAIPLAKDANDRLHEAVKRHPDRFAGFAALPTAAPDAAADELERAVTKLGFKGTMIHGHTRGSFLDEKKYWVIFERAQALGVPVYLHPTLPHPDVVKAYFTGYEDLARAAWGFGVDTSCHFLRLVFAGVFDAYPNLKIILGHLGECLPFAMHRMNDHTFPAAKRRGLRKTPLQYLYARVSGRFGACLCIGGPGAANTLPAAIAAQSDQARVLFITGDVPTALQGRGAFQDGSLDGTRDVEFLRPATVYSEEVELADQLPRQLAAAVRAMCGCCGASRRAPCGAWPRRPPRAGPGRQR